MGDKGKKDKEKSQKQKAAKQRQKAKRKLDKQQKRTPEQKTWWVVHLTHRAPWWIGSEGRFRPVSFSARLSSNTWRLQFVTKSVTWPRNFRKPTFKPQIELRDHPSWDGLANCIHKGRRVYAFPFFVGPSALTSGYSATEFCKTLLFSANSSGYEE